MLVDQPTLRLGWLLSGGATPYLRVIAARGKCRIKFTGAMAKAWCLLVHAEASLSLSRSHHAPVPRRPLNIVFALAVDAAKAALDSVTPDVPYGGASHREGDVGENAVLAAGAYTRPLFGST